MPFLNSVYAASGELPLISNIKAYIINPLITLLVVASLVLFFLGVAEFINGGGLDKVDKEGKKTGASKQHMLWGIIGLFIAVSAFGIMNLIASTIQQIAH